MTPIQEVIAQAENEIRDVEDGGKQLSLPGMSRSYFGLMTEEDLGKLLGVTTLTLAKWRNQEGKGPAFIRPSKTVFYRHVDVVAWLERIAEWPKSGNARPENPEKHDASFAAAA